MFLNHYTLYREQICGSRKTSVKLQILIINLTKFACQKFYFIALSLYIDSMYAQYIELILLQTPKVRPILDNNSTCINSHLELMSPDRNFT